MLHLSRVLIHSRNVPRSLQHLHIKRNFHLCLASNITPLSGSTLKLVPTQRLELYNNSGLRLTQKRNFDDSSSVGLRFFSSKDDSDGENRPPDDDSYNTQLPATVAVPEVWPHVPVIAISRNIVFPRFIKLIELTQPQLIELIRRKVKLNQPYCGIFLKKNEENDSEVVNNINDVYNVGVFAQIHEMQDLGDRLRLVVMAHRRIKITGQILDSGEAPPKGMCVNYTNNKA
jgi:hypothetical protein